MKRLRRFILNALTVMSAVLCVGGVGLWVRSYWVEDKVERTTGDKMMDQQWVTSEWGEMYVGTMRHGWHYLGLRPPEPGIHHESFPASARSADALPGFLGFGKLPDDLVRPEAHFIIVMPDWFLTGLFAAMPAAYLIRRVRRRRKPLPGYCQTCGYDLRATPDRCPECGTVPHRRV